MNIEIYPRKHVENIISWKIKPGSIGNKWALISISGQSSVKIDQLENRRILKEIGCEEILSVVFDDVTDQDNAGVHLLFNNGIARQIINFVDKYKDVDTLVVHCAAGISRSGAVGVFAARYLNLDENKLYDRFPIIPNQFVLKILMDESGLNNSYFKMEFK